MSKTMRNCSVLQECRVTMGRFCYSVTTRLLHQVFLSDFNRSKTVRAKKFDAPQKVPQKFRKKVSQWKSALKVPKFLGGGGFTLVAKYPN